MVPSDALPVALLHPRPPTPPREQHPTTIDDDLGDIIDSLEDSFQIEKATNPSGLTKPIDTPQQTPPSSIDHTAGRSSRRSKKVDFSPWSSFHRQSKPLEKTPDVSGTIRPLPPSRTLSASKSILKATSHTSPLRSPATPRPRLCSTHQYDTFADMLEAVLDALASEERDLRLDAYTTLLRTLGAHNDVPDADTLRPKATRLVQCILRDISTVNAATNAPDSQLTGEACKLLCALTRVPGVSDTLGDENCAAILKKCITSTEDTNASKASIRHYLFLLAEQRFPTRVMTVERVGRILDVLRTIEERYPGNSIVATRLLIYKRLAEQCSDYMTLRINAWLEHIFHGMLSSLDEIRSRAVDSGTTLALATGNNSDTSKALITLFKQEDEKGLSYGDYVAGRLLTMICIKTKGGEQPDPTKLQQSRHVPQIWAVAILFFRSRRERINTWSQFKLWLNVISQCFNSSDVQTKFHASVAWNRLVYVLMPSASTEPKMYNMLKQPMSAQLGTKGIDKFAMAIRKYALGSFCNLLHYAFRPTASPADWSRAWEVYVPPLVELLSKRSDVTTALDLTRSLMISGVPKLWNENRANEAPFVLDTRDVLPLDVRWIRQNVQQILPVMAPLLRKADSAEDSEQRVSATKAWSALLNAVAEAGSKEITASREFKEAIARLLEFFFNTWPEDETVSQVSAHLKLGIMIVETLGPAHFSEVLLKPSLTQQAGQASFEVVSTPSANRKRGSVDAALGHLVRFLCLERDTSIYALTLKAANDLLGICLTANNGDRRDIEALSKFVAASDAKYKAALVDEELDATDEAAGFPNSPRPLLRSPLARKATAAPSPLRSARRSKSPFLAPPALSSRRSTPRKLRHEDSQIQFEPIHSSPPDADAQTESQHLTDHQKEVSERQQETANIFSDISVTSPAHALREPSSNANRLPPRPSSASRMRAKLQSTACKGDEEPERASTPPLPLPEVGMSDDLPASSPVQSASERRTNTSQRGEPPRYKQLKLTTATDNPSLFDIPSSPPRSDDIEFNDGQGDALVIHDTVDDVKDSTVIEDTMLDTATEVADEIIERNMSSTEDHASGSTTDSGTPAVQGRPQVHDAGAQDVVELSAQESEAPIAKLDPDSDERPALAQVEADNNSASSDDPTLCAAQLDAEYKQYVNQRRETENSQVQTTSPPAHEQQDSCSATERVTINVPATSSGSQPADVHETETSGSHNKITDSFVAPTAPAPTSQPGTQRRSLRRAESIPSDASTPSQQHQGTKRKRGPGRPPKITKLQRAESDMSSSPAAPSPSSQSRNQWQLYSNDDSDIEEHIFVQRPGKKRAGKRSLKQPSVRQVQAIASRLFGDVAGSSPHGRRRARSESGASEQSGSMTSSPGRKLIVVPVVRRQSSRLSQSSPDPKEEDIVPRKEDMQVEGEKVDLTARPIQTLPTPVAAEVPDIAETHEGKANDAPNEMFSPNNNAAPTRKRKRTEESPTASSPPAAQPIAEEQTDVTRTPIRARSQNTLEVPASQARSILSPSSLLRGLRGILEGCKNAVMGSQEEREVDDVLFEIRREVHEAGRRAKRPRFG